MKKLFYVVYRTGTPENCIWERTEPMGKVEARRKVDFFENGNVKAFIVDKKMSDIIGLPQGWEYKKNGIEIRTCGCRNGSIGIHANFCLFYGSINEK